MGRAHQFASVQPLVYRPLIKSRHDDTTTCPAYEPGINRKKIAMTITALAGLLLLSQFALLASILYLRYLTNKKLFKTDAPLTPIRPKGGFFGGFTGFFDFMDRIPLLRRSGTANEIDLLKAILLVTVPVFLLNLLAMHPSALVALMAGNVMMILINGIVLAHPLLKR